MDTQTLVNKTNRKLNGEYEEIEFESDDWNNIVDALNYGIDLWNKAGDWRSKYDPEYSIGTVGDDIYYQIDNNEVNSISFSDRAMVVFKDSDGKVISRYKIVSQDVFDLANDNDEIATINMNGLQIKQKESTSSIYGCDIYLPVFHKEKPLTTKTQVCRVDDPYWVIDIAAADLAATSPVEFIARNAQGYIKSANNRMIVMKKDNRGTQSSSSAIGQWCPSGRPDGR